MIPAPHLRAVAFVVERAAMETKKKGSYILDLGPYPAQEMARYSNSRYWDAEGVVDDSKAIKERRPPVPSVGPHLPGHHCMSDGLPCLKESIRIATTYYPE